MAKSAFLDQSLNVYDIIMKGVHPNVDVLISQVDIFDGQKDTFDLPPLWMGEQTAPSAPSLPPPLPVLSAELDRGGGRALLDSVGPGRIGQGQLWFG